MRCIEISGERAWAIRRIAPDGRAAYWRGGDGWSGSARFAAIFWSEGDACDQVLALRVAGLALPEICEAVPLEGALAKEEAEKWQAR